MPTPMVAVLSEDEKNRIRYHTGYLATLSAASIQLGFPRASQPQFLVEQAMNLIPEAAIGNTRRLIAVLDGIEQKLIGAQDRLAATKLGEITLNGNEPDQLEREYKRWAQRLADQLGIPLNVYSERFRNGMGASINVPVQH